MYEEYSEYKDGEQMMIIRDYHLQDDADGSFPVLVEESDIESSEPNDSDVVEQRIPSIHIHQDAGRPAKQTCWEWAIAFHGMLLVPLWMLQDDI
jgi:hypothetical protein